MKSRPLAEDGFKLEPAGEEVVIFHPARSRVLRTNGSGALVFRLCNGELTTEQIVGLLRDAYPDSRGEIETDVAEVLEQLTTYGAVRWI